MTSASESQRGPKRLLLRIALIIVCVFCGIGLLAASGLAGGLLAMHWLF